ncbi:hypothetical protein BU107_13580 [Staphylococcus xylosus]|nr:hypothetical protein BU107_13580 [Staphylococcus xylosus]
MLSNAKLKECPNLVVVNVEIAQESVFINILEGSMKAEKGARIIIRVNGEKSTVKSDIFEKTYEVLPD